jgi:hypothetical protein
MPQPEQPEKSMQIWNLLKDAVGSKDILNIPLPAAIHLPLSELQVLGGPPLDPFSVLRCSACGCSRPCVYVDVCVQKQSEEAEYSELLDKVQICLPCPS